MSDRGQFPGEGPTACPFVAFDDDRDRRSVEPDHRHRCYAEERPAPRALAHQAAYCLTASFPACPTFVDWARRETAAPVAAPIAPPLPGPSFDDEDSFVDDLPPRHPRRRDWASPPRWMAEASGGQLRAFEDEAGPMGDAGPAAEDGPADAAALPAPDRRRRTTRPLEPVEPAEPVEPVEPRSGADEPSSEPLPRRRVHRAAPGALSGREQLQDVRRPDEGPPIDGPPPAFLADRAARAPLPTELGTPAGPGPTRFRSRDARDRRAREDEDAYESGGQARRLQPRERRRPGSLRDTPSWEAPRRYEAYPTLRTRVGLPRLPPLALALLAVLVAAALLFALPSIFGGGGTPASPTPTTRPSASAAGSVAPSGPASPTPQTYVVRPGDTLIRIADQFGLTVGQMMVANPRLQDPDSIRVDDVLTIPPPGSPGSSPSGSPSAAP